MILWHLSEDDLDQRSKALCMHSTLCPSSRLDDIIAYLKQVTIIQQTDVLGVFDNITKPSGS